MLTQLIPQHSDSLLLATATRISPRPALATARRSAEFVALLMILGVLSLAGRAEAQSPEPFTKLFRIIDSTVLESTAKSPLVRMSGFARLQSGVVVVSDFSESNLRFHKSDGGLQQIYGRKGEGPGEFRAPVLPRVDAKGRIHVPDIALMRVSVLEPTGAAAPPRLVRTVPLNAAVRAIFGFDILDNGDYLIVGAGGTKRHALFVVDSLGKLKSSHLEILGYRPTPTSPEVEGLWQAITVPGVATDGRLAFVTMSTFDSLWTVDPVAGTFTAMRMPSRGYRQPVIPAPVPQSRDAIRSWVTAQTVVLPFASRGHLFVPFFRGTYNEGQVSDVLHRGRNGKWALFSGMPTILLARGDTVFALRSIQEPITVLRMVARP